MSIDTRVDPRAGPLLGSPNRLKLAVFSANMAGGANLTRAAEAPRATWPESVRIAQAAEAAGIEALIPVARWRGMAAPDRRDAHRSYETFTWAAGIAAVTRRLQVFATFHVPLTHPVAAAKQIATVDHISEGRFALNVVAGWNTDELRMFGITQPGREDRYALAGEWMTLLERIWAATGEFDFHGRFYQAHGVVSEPKPLQDGGPVVMNAGISPAGRAFAARHADLAFAMLPDTASAAEVVTGLKRHARQQPTRRSRAGDLLVFTAAHIVCAETEQAARRAYARMVGELADLEAARRALELLIPDAGRGGANLDGMVRLATAGFFALPLIGTPESVAQQMADLAAAGLDGLALSWLDYETGIRQYQRQLRPLLAQAGLREG